MNFHEIPYERVTCEELVALYEELFDALEHAQTDEDCQKVLTLRYALSNRMTPMDICYVRNAMDLNDPFYAAEQAYYNEISPKLSELATRFSRLLLDSPKRDYFEKVMGKQAISLMETGLLCYDERLNNLSREENALTARYNLLTANATVNWEGESISRGRMSTYTQSPDRETRKKAAAAISDSWEEQRGELEELYANLVANRDRQAKALGYPNFVEMSYYRMARIGYGPREVSAFRDAVKKHIVPLHTQLEEKRKKRLHLDHLYSYDGGIFFENGNPVPLGGTEECLAATREMYHRLSPETAEFIDCLLDNQLYDVEMRIGKKSGGYMTSFESLRLPFIFANFDGTSENAYIMCHEAGHAFQYYLKRDDEIREHCWLTSEAAETHAMAMELFTYPYMELFFGERAEDYRIRHLTNTLWRIAYQCEQDEFQQLVYERPDMTNDERNALWAKLEKEYFPTKDVSGNKNLSDGCGWQRIPHAFLWPFYAIDYGLAQVAALGFYRMYREDAPAAWENYLRFCQTTGELSFPALMEQAGLGSPFAEETIASLAEWLRENCM
jgi:M3 family oligoendopeptidase